MMKFCVVARPGYFGRNQAQVFGAYKTLASARKALGSAQSACVVRADKKKGEIVWGDMFPPIIQ